MDHSGGYVVGVRDESIDWFTQADVDEGTVSFVSSSDKVQCVPSQMNILNRS